MHHGVTLIYLALPILVCSPAIFEICFPMTKIYGLLQLIIICTFT